MLGLPYGTVKLAPHSAQWKEYYTIEEQLLQETIGCYIAEMRHIGSTAIPGIEAKPIIDIMAGLRRLEDLEACITRLQTIGYIYKGEQDVPGWHFFIKGTEERITHHLHLVVWNSNYWIEHILFQEYLCRCPKVAEAYEKLKRKLAKKYPNDREAYTRDKSRFIRQVVELARREYHDLAPKDMPCPIHPSSDSENLQQEIAGPQSHNRP